MWPPHSNSGPLPATQILHSTADFRSIYSSAKVTVTEADDSTGSRPRARKKKVPIMELWLASSDKRVCGRLDFLASEEERQQHGDDIFSSFNGLALDDSEPIDFDTAKNHFGVRLIRKHVYYILADCNLEVTAWLENFLAWSLQMRKKCGVFVCISGAPGCGKSTLFFDSTENNPIFPKLFANTYMATSGLSQLMTRFNALSGSKLFCVCEELKSAPTRAVCPPLPPATTSVLHLPYPGPPSRQGFGACARRVEVPRRLCHHHDRAEAPRPVRRV